MAIHIGRREFVVTLGGAALRGRSRRARSRRERMRRIGVLLPAAADDSTFQTWVGAFLQGLGQAGWTIGRNLRIDARWAMTPGDIRRQAAELAALAPDVILAHGASTVGPLLQATRTVPIVFPVAGDPVAAGLVDSLARPGGNATGFLVFEYSLSGKWLEMLKEIAPSVTRAAVFRDPTQGGGTSQFAAIQAVAPSLRVEVTPVNMRDAGEIERTVAAFAGSPNAGLIMTSGPNARLHRDLIITLAVRHKLPAVYPERSFVAAGGLISYGSDYIDQYRQAAGYVDRILKGEKPADLPVQAPTKYELGDQPQDREGARHRGAADAARPRRRGDRVRRREFITLLGGAAVAWPLAARAQQGERVRRIGLLTSVIETDPDFQARLRAFRQALQQLGWTEGRNVRIDYRFGSVGDPDRIRADTRRIWSHSRRTSSVATGSPDRDSVATNEPDRPDRVRGYRRSSRRRLRRKPRTSGRQHDRLHQRSNTA